MSTTEVFVISDWSPLEQGYGRGSNVSHLLVPHETSGSRQQEVVQSLDLTAVPSLYRLHANRWEVVGAGDELAAAARQESTELEQYPSQLEVSGAGLEAVNGTYKMSGSVNNRPRWLLDQQSGPVYLRGGSDGNWCIVNNADGKTPGKKFFYVNTAADLFAPWSADEHGQLPVPLVTPAGEAAPFVAPAGEVAPQGTPILFELALKEAPKSATPPNAQKRIVLAIARHGSALIAAPPVPEGRRPVALHLHHFHHDTTLWAAAGAVTECSFGGLDDEQISRENSNAVGEVWSYVGK